MTKTKDLKKKLIKEKIKKIINVVCYVLSVAFILLMVIVGVQSCANKHSASAVNKLAPRKSDNLTSEPYYYKSINSGYFNSTINTNNTFCAKFNLPSNPQFHDTYDYLINADFDYFNYDNSTWYYNQKIHVEFLYDYVGGYFDADMWVFNRLYTESTDLIYYDGYEIDDGSIFLTYVQNDYTLRSYQVVALLNDFYTFDEGYNFTFNKVFNYNAFVEGGTLGETYFESPFNSVDGWHYGQTLTNSVTYYLTTPVFFCGNEQFNCLIYELGNENGALFDIKQDGNYFGLPNDGSYYASLSYAWRSGVTYTKQKLVNTRNKITGYSDMYNLPYWAYTNDTTWVNDSYRSISFIEPLDNLRSNAILSFNNNNQNYIVQDNTINIFTLVSSAFASWLPVLSVYLLPGITIGTLLFIPLVAMLVFAIVRIIKK